MDRPTTIKEAPCIVAPMAYLSAMQIVRTSLYRRDLKRLRMTAAEADAIETAIATNPTLGDVIVGLGGVRKVRFALRNKGKSGGGRAIYLLMLDDDTAVMLAAYAKNEKADLTPADRKALEALVKELTG